MMFSVVIPCCNRLRQLALVLAGFCAQDARERFELILVDNNGFETDIDALFRRYVDLLPLTLLRQPQLTHPRATSLARNRGLALARHEWIISLDADCIPPPDYLRRIREAIEPKAGQNLLIAGLRKFVCADGVSEDDLRHGCAALGSLPAVASPANYGRTVDRRHPEIEAVADSPHPWAFMHSGNLIYRRDMALAIGGFDEAFDGVWGYEDIDFAHRAITAAGAIPAYLAGIECYHQDTGLDPATAAAEAAERVDKTGNPNWLRVCGRIPGYEQYKREQYRKLSPGIRL